MRQEITCRVRVVDPYEQDNMTYETFETMYPLEYLKYLGGLIKEGIV